MKINRINEIKEQGNELLSYYPKVGRGPCYERNSNNLPIGEYLHSMHRELEQLKNKAKNEKELRIQNEVSYSFTQATSIKMFEKIKLDAFNNIFRELDSDNDGEISSKKMNNNSILI